MLGHLGFVSSGLTRTAQNLSSTDEDLNEAILPVITAAFAGAAIPALVIATLQQLSAASEDRPWLKLFEQESRRFGAQQFQISMVESEADTLVVRMLGFVLEVTQQQAQVLFFRHARDTGAVERLEGTFSVPSATLAALAPDIANKLASRRPAYIAALEILSGAERRAAGAAISAGPDHHPDRGAAGRRHRRRSCRCPRPHL